MQTATLLRLLANAGSADDPNHEDEFGPMPELPSLRQRWTVRRKAAVIEAVRGGWVPIEEVCQLYNLSVDEFRAWERDIDRHGIHGLRTTRYQIYRDTEMGRDRARHRDTGTRAGAPLSSFPRVRPY
jgi:hypothetical protein